jgi:hypothetical protein
MAIIRIPENGKQNPRIQGARSQEPGEKQEKEYTRKPKHGIKETGGGRRSRTKK